MSKAFNAIVLPALAADGFRQYAGKEYGRVVERVLFQFLVLHVRSVMRREFFLEFGCMLLPEPHSHLVLQPGGRFPDDCPRSTSSFRADTVDRLNASLRAVREAYQSITAPWFRRCATLDGFIGALEAEVPRKPYLMRVGHASFSIACAHHLAGRDAVAIINCQAAQEQFRLQFAEAPVREWARDCEGKAEAYLHALEEGTADRLHEEWAQHTIGHLKLEPLRDGV